MPRQGVTTHRIREATFPILQCWDAHAWAQSADLWLPFRNSHGHCANVLRKTGLILLSILRSWYLVGLADLILTKLWYMCCRISWTRFFLENIQTHPIGIQYGSGHDMATSKKVDLDRVKVVHYCAGVSFYVHFEFVHGNYIIYN